MTRPRPGTSAHISVDLPWQILEWARDHPEYPTRHLTGLVTAAGGGATLRRRNNSQSMRDLLSSRVTHQHLMRRRKEQQELVASIAELHADATRVD